MFYFYCSPVTVLVPSEWVGNYTCSVDSSLIDVQMNITRSDTIQTIASFYFVGNTVSMDGTFANAMQILALETKASTETFHRQIGTNVYTRVELNTRLVNAAYMTGFLLFKGSSNTIQCTIDLYKEFGKCTFTFRLKKGFFEFDKSIKINKVTYR